MIVEAAGVAETEGTAMDETALLNLIRDGKNQTEMEVGQKN